MIFFIVFVSGFWYDFVTGEIVSQQYCVQKYYVRAINVSPSERNFFVFRCLFYYLRERVLNTKKKKHECCQQTHFFMRSGNSIKTLYLPRIILPLAMYTQKLTTRDH